MRIAFATVLALLATGCGLRFDVSRISGLNATFDLARDPEEAILPQCRLVVPKYATEASPATVRFERRFEFRGVEHSIAVDVDARLLEASRTIGTERCVMTEFEADEFYESVVFDPAEEPFFQALLAELRRIRKELRLERSRYIEMVVAFVQSLDYEVGDDMPKHPIAAFADGVGDCDEKSALLAGLLAREGYDVCLFLFLEQQHMAVGLRAAGLDYRDTGYAYVEATTPSYIGHSAGGGEGPVPEVLEMGDGELEYTPSREQIYLDLAAYRSWRMLEVLIDGLEETLDSPDEQRRAEIAFTRLMGHLRGDEDPAALRRVLDALAAFAPPEIEKTLRALAVYVVVASRPDAGDAFAAVSAVIDPAEDALIRGILERPDNGGISSLEEPR